MIWTVLTCIATLISMGAYIITAMYIRAELKGLEKDRYLAVTSQLFTTWQSKEFMEAQLWLLYRLQETTWEGFVAAHRADMGEMAFHQVGAFYDRVGTLIKMNLIDDQEILATMGGYAIAVWQKIGPLVLEARNIENSVLFQNYERMLPACHECYVPSLKMDTPVMPFSLVQPTGGANAAAPNAPRPLASDLPAAGANAPIESVGRAGAFSRAKKDANAAGQDADRVSVSELQRQLKRPSPPVVLDVRQPSQTLSDNRTLPGAVFIPPDQIEGRYGELPTDRAIVVFCA